MIFALIGNQNCGKTTLFNQMTGSNQHVGNFPGVTVDQKMGKFSVGSAEGSVVDLPGIYSLRPYTNEEIVTRDFLLKEKPDGIINIVDATNIERNLYLTLQLIEMRIPMVLALNMMDEVRNNGGSINVKEMSRLLGIPIIPISAIRNEGVEDLIHTACEVAENKQYPKVYDFCTPGPVHRLDRNTSGLVIFGKDMRALQDLNTMMKTRQGIEKKYLTIAMGHMKDATLSGYVKKNEDEGKMYLVKKDTPGALSMKTIVHVLKRCSTCSLVEVQLITGRTHQIRIHLSATGHPVMGDSKYGDFEWNKEVKKKFHLNHQFLHAYQLTFVDPIGSMSYLKGKTVTSQLPEQLEKIQKELFS